MMMKKTFVIVLFMLMAIGFTACGSNEDILQNEPIQWETIPEESDSTEEIETESEKQDEVGQESVNEPETETANADEQESEEKKGNDSDNVQDDELEENLAKYREEREKMTNISLGNGVSGYGAPNAEDYGFSSDESEYLLQFDSRELSEAYETAKKYVTDTLGIAVETKSTVYACVDSRVTEIYEAEDKGVANGYEPKNIFVCEYCDAGNWKYLVLVREAKGEEWKVIHHGTSYKE